MSRPQRPIGVLIAVGLLLYPLVVFGLWNAVPRWWLAVVPLLLIAARGFAPVGALHSGALIAAGGVSVYLALLATMGEAAVLYYPIVVNVTLALTFGITLLRPPSLIESLSRAVGMEVTERGVTYTRGVTLLWTGFFATNAVVCAIVASQGTVWFWGLYNGLISNAAAAALFGAEYWYRQRYRLRHAE